MQKVVFVMKNGVIYSNRSKYTGFLTGFHADQDLYINPCSSVA